MALASTAFGFVPTGSNNAGAARTRASNVLLQLSDYDQATYDPERSGLNVQPLADGDREEGMHSTGFRFMPLQVRNPSPLTFTAHTPRKGEP